MKGQSNLYGALTQAMEEHRYDPEGVTYRSWIFSIHYNREELRRNPLDDLPENFDYEVIRHEALMPNLTILLLGVGQDYAKEEAASTKRKNRGLSHPTPIPLSLISLRQELTNSIPAHQSYLLNGEDQNIFLWGLLKPIFKQVAEAGYGGVALTLPPNGKVYGKTNWAAFYALLESEGITVTKGEDFHTFVWDKDFPRLLLGAVL